MPGHRATKTWFDLPEDFGTLGVPVPFCNAVRFGDLVLVTGQTGEKPSDADHPRGQTGPAHQAESAMADVLALLDQAGASPSDVVRLNSYHCGQQVWKETVGPQVSAFDKGPAHSSLDVRALMMPSYEIEIDAIAVTGGTKRYSNFPPGRPGLTDAPFHAGVRAGDLVFVGSRLDVGLDGVIRHPNDVVAQTRAILGDIVRMSNDSVQTDVQPTDIVKTSVALVAHADWSPSARLRSEFLAHGVATTDVMVADLGAPGARIQIEATAVIGGADAFADPAGQNGWPEATSFHAGVRAGNLVFVSGQVALDKEGQVLHPGDMARQTRVVMDNIRGVLAELDVEMDSVLRKNTFYVDLDPESWKQAAPVRAEYFTKGPCATGVGVLGAVVPGLLICAEVIAAVES